MQRSRLLILVGLLLLLGIGAVFLVLTAVSSSQRDPIPTIPAFGDPSGDGQPLVFATPEGQPEVKPTIPPIGVGGGAETPTPPIRPTAVPAQATAQPTAVPPTAQPTAVPTFNPESTALPADEPHIAVMTPQVAMTQVTVAGGELPLTTAGVLPGLLSQANYVAAANKAGKASFATNVSKAKLESGFYLLGWSANKVLNEPWFAMTNPVYNSGFIKSPHPGTITGKGNVSFTMVGTSLNPKASSGKPALLFSGDGQLTLTIGARTECYLLNTRKLAVDLKNPVKIEYVGSFFEADYRDAGADGRRIQVWPGEAPMQGQCGGYASQGETLWGSNDMIANVTKWAGVKFQPSTGKILELPKGYDFSFPHIATTMRSNPWTVAFADVTTEGNVELCEATSVCIRGNTSLIVAGTAELFRTYGPNSKPALGISGYGNLRVTELSKNNTVCIALNTGRPQISLDKGLYYKLDFVGTAAQIDVGPTAPPASTDLRWPNAKIPDASLCR